MMRTFKKSAVSWGVRVTCVEPGCTRSVITWNDDGTPALPLIGAHEGGNLSGWCILFRKRKDNYPHDYTTGHVTYCPAHAGPAREWLNIWHKWQDDRHEAGKKIALTWEEQLGVLMSDRQKLDEISRRMADVMRQWERDNPIVPPPWVTRR